MKILLINHYAGSLDLGMEYRPYYMAKEWIKKGHDVTILAGSFSHVRTNQPELQKDFEEQEKEGIRYVWIKTPKYSGNGLSRFIGMLTFVFKILMRAKSISRKYSPEVVVASSTYPLDNYAARFIARLSKAKHIYEVHDLWPLSPMELGGMSKKHPFIMIMQAAENYAYKHAHQLISMLPKTLDHMLQHGLQSEKWHYIPNGINMDEWENQTGLPIDIQIKISGLKDNGYFLIGYTGSIGLANALDNFLNVSKELLNQKVIFIIVGNGPEKERLINKAKNEKLANVLFLDPVSKQSIPHLLQYFDVLYIGLQRQPLFRFGISPNKLLDYMMAAKPIIQAIDAGNDMVSEASCGLSIKAEDPEALISAIKKMLAFSDEERKVLGENGKKFVQKNHDYKMLAEKMLNIFKTEKIST